MPGQDGGVTSLRWRPPAGSAPPALLRDLVIITTRLAGHAWLEANADSTAALAAVRGSWRLPPLPELDQILARVLWDRFGLLSPAAA